jgi:putative phosphonate metabolism protein
MTARYAVYFAPDAASPLAVWAAAWLGYDVATGTAVPQPAVAGIAAERLREITAEPRRYGFHATLKPPFALAAGHSADELDTAIATMAGGLAAFTAPPLRLSNISGFWALTLSAPCPAMLVLADTCVRAIDRFRAPPSQAELARRRRAGLTPRQEALLAEWGYPYVMDEFRFHLTLTGRLGGAERDAVGQQLAPLVEPFCRDPLPADAICLFRQNTSGTPFRLVRRYPLGG